MAFQAGVLHADASIKTAAATCVFICTDLKDQERMPDDVQHLLDKSLLQSVMMPKPLCYPFKKLSPVQNLQTAPMLPLVCALSLFPRVSRQHMLQAMDKSKRQSVSVLNSLLAKVGMLSGLTSCVACSMSRQALSCHRYERCR